MAPLWSKLLPCLPRSDASHKKSSSPPLPDDQQQSHAQRSQPATPPQTPPKSHADDQKEAGDANITPRMATLRVDTRSSKPSSGPSMTDQAASNSPTPPRTASPEGQAPSASQGSLAPPSRSPEKQTSNHLNVQHSIALIPPTPVDGRDLPFSSRPANGENGREDENVTKDATVNASPDRRQTLSPRSTLSEGLTPPSSPSPPPWMRHHQRTSSSSSRRSFRETVNAFSNDGADGVRTVNQYELKGRLGVGSYATVEKATNRDDGHDYAVKEFSKARLRRSAVAEARKGGARRPRNREALQEQSAALLEIDDEGPGNLALVRTEVAIMKKLDHPNVASIHEVIDVTSEDALLVVMELCAGGPIIKVSAQEESEPMSEDTARSVFGQIVMGVAYLHRNSVVHRDIKPDNCLYMEDMETVKIVDFGVSEMFAIPGDDTVVKSAGSPAFMAPELVSSNHTHLHGYACDVWSLGVTLYAIVVGRLPFVKDNVLDLYTSICEDEITYPSHLSSELKSLLSRLLQRDPHARPTLKALWDDPWITNHSQSPLVPYEENCRPPIEEPTTHDVEGAIVSFRSRVLAARAANKFRTIGRRSLSNASNGGAGDEQGSNGGSKVGTPKASDERAETFNLNADEMKKIADRVAGAKSKGGEEEDGGGATRQEELEVKPKAGPEPESLPAKDDRQAESGGPVLVEEPEEDKDLEAHYGNPNATNQKGKARRTARGRAVNG